MQAASIMEASRFQKIIQKWITGKPNTGKQQKCKRLLSAPQVDESVTRRGIIFYVRIDCKAVASDGERTSMLAELDLTRQEASDWNDCKSDDDNVTRVREESCDAIALGG